MSRAETFIHPSAVIEPGAKIGAGCQIGPFSLIGPEVTLGAGVIVKSHAVITGWTDLGDDCVVFPFACVGEIPQDLKFAGERTRLIVGARCRIREGATLNTGTAGGGGVTRVGDDCLFMTGAHVGHDVQVGNGVILANQAALAGHCIIGDRVIIGGLSGVHQHVRVGAGAIIGAVTMVVSDVMPYGLVQGPRGVLDGLNLVGLKRRGLDRAEIGAMRAAYTELAREDGTLHERAQALHDTTDSAHIREMTGFLLADSGRHYLKPQ
ncbi:acyl-ACP--UDP-N-acetylglucosamine O-acyltransferase [Roseicitreum antarcticum]|uniref:Acyl-[acyl-carrier-protein]--UDP-N-acetylglucosamine O-acyltransferase n=1 Tax=Roseicitreum antarcticum TaxID=564137 RepID=A0A1H3BQR1_9RHOB|nr:acyl-ACP--UDP-N-acetylglucosamine O-acyltransferase [Roseicitreum antarcticum]SDX44302.1 acyl-[acyl-carrier-protein]--UDP-N-acetylglucosamine O-acyltransferase [Roseicitreum antarcticum]